ncbi:PASTA domain-containing protein [Amycolatopsis sp. GM8]|uniref:PASTA domain-containing protein n=1 Tax=Amycolatopsis sp. GM8 TaxID=2896530 RepID=UPI001F297FC8|nr:PASTA domain-containing protein [Amycolatopsis sp. GM8]
MTGTLSWNQTLLLVLIVAVAVLVAGLIVILARSKGKQADPGGSVVRSWIAVSLVLGLVLFTAFTFAINDSNLRSTLVGGLTASVGSAIAYYFSTKSSDQARQDLLSATVGTEPVPALAGLTEADALMALGKTTLRLQIDPATPSAAPAVVREQTPPAGTPIPNGGTVRVRFGAP